MSDEAEMLRIDDEEWEAEDSRQEPPSSGGAASVVGRTKTLATYPGAPGSYYAMETIDVTGDEAEGGAATFTARGDTFFAVNLGSAIPPSGTNVICTFTPYRWSFRYD